MVMYFYTNPIFKVALAFSAKNQLSFPFSHHLIVFYFWPPFEQNIQSHRANTNRNGEFLYICIVYQGVKTCTLPQTRTFL